MTVLLSFVTGFVIFVDMKRGKEGERRRGEREGMGRKGKGRKGNRKGKGREGGRKEGEGRREGRKGGRKEGTGWNRKWPLETDQNTPELQLLPSSNTYPM